MICARCHQDREIEPGLKRCANCRRQRSEYRKRHPEVGRNQARKLRLKDPEKARERGRRYQKNLRMRKPEKVREKAKARRERIRANPERYAKYLATQKKARQDRRDRMRTERPEEFKKLIYRLNQRNKRRGIAKRARQNNPEEYRRAWTIRFNAWAAKNEPRRKLSQELSKAIKRGEMVRPSTCPDCGAGGRIIAYLGVATLAEVTFHCRDCHTKKVWPPPE